LDAFLLISRFSFRLIRFLIFLHRSTQTVIVQAQDDIELSTAAMQASVVSMNSAHNDNNLTINNMNNEPTFETTPSLSLDKSNDSFSVTINRFHGQIGQYGQYEKNAQTGQNGQNRQIGQNHIDIDPNHPNKKLTNSHSISLSISPMPLSISPMPPISPSLSFSMSHSNSTSNLRTIHPSLSHDDDTFDELI
jgi:hypothetical protein